MYSVFIVHTETTDIHQQVSKTIVYKRTLADKMDNEELQGGSKKVSC